MNLNQEKRIIETAVYTAIKRRWGQITRHEAAHDAALLADKKGVNVQTAPYLQNIFCDSLDEQDRKGAFIE